MVLKEFVKNSFSKYLAILRKKIELFYFFYLFSEKILQVY